MTRSLLAADDHNKLSYRIRRSHCRFSDEPGRFRAIARASADISGPPAPVCMRMKAVCLASLRNQTVAGFQIPPVWIRPEQRKLLYPSQRSHVAPAHSQCQTRAAGLHTHTETVSNPDGARSRSEPPSLPALEFR